MVSGKRWGKKEKKTQDAPDFRRGRRRYRSVGLRGSIRCRSPGLSPPVFGQSASRNKRPLQGCFGIAFRGISPPISEFFAAVSRLLHRPFSAVSVSVTNDLFRTDPTPHLGGFFRFFSSVFTAVTEALQPVFGRFCPECQKDLFKRSPNPFFRRFSALSSSFRPLAPM